MTRLTNDMREKIATNAIEHKFKPLVTALAEDYATLANEVYEDVFKSSLKRMLDLPGGWLPTHNSITAQFGAKVHNLDFDGDFASRYNDSINVYYMIKRPGLSRRFTDNKKGLVAAVYDATHKFSERLDALGHRKDALTTDVSAAKKAIAATLDKFFTVEKLLEAWPEIEPMTAGVAPTPIAKVPAVPVNHLNTMLDLPVAAE